MVPLLALASWQAVLETAMRDIQGTAIAADVRTGRVLARSGAPDQSYSPGSVIKPFVVEAADPAALRHPLVCRRDLKIGTRTLGCVHPSLASSLDPGAALAYSCNSYFAGLADRIPPDRLVAHLRKQGFEVNPPRSAEERKLLALGEHGVQITPGQLLQAYVRLARAEHAVIAEGLQGAVEFGTAQLAAAAGVPVAGKTGTTATPGRTGTRAWFAGWAPARNPEVALVVFVARGQGGGSAAPIAGRVFANLSPRPAPLPAVTVRMFKDQKIRTVDMEEYVEGVLAGEASGFAPEALKAMAVAARTWAMAHRGRHQQEGFDFCESTHCQDYRLDARTAGVRSAARATSGEILWYGGKPALTFYHKDCGGILESYHEAWGGPRLAYLLSKPDAACQRRGTGKWRMEIDAREVSVTGRTGSGRAREVRVDGVTAPHEEFQRATGNRVRSPLFRLARSGNRIWIEGSGEGHGVGLCQIGANERAQRGENYHQILAFYYDGAGEPQDAWRKLSAPGLEVWATTNESGLLDLLTRALREAERRVGGRLSGPARVRVFGSTAAFRDATGEPGWVAASTLRGEIRLQPADVLRSRGALDSVLLHEMLHLAVQGRARRAVPAWFEEGLVQYLEDPSKPPADTALVESNVARPPNEAAMRQAYDAARSRVSRLVARHGRAVVLGWLETGVPR